jgi:tetratricopeptide (TPR) repeat protein
MEEIMSKVFISHSSSDVEFALSLTSDLISLGHEAWLDKREIKVGDNIMKKIERAIAEAHYVVIILSKEAVASRWVEREWQSKYWDEISLNRTSVLPVLIEDCEVPPFLKTKQVADFRGKYARGLASLHAALSIDGQSERPSDSAQAWTPQNSKSQEVYNLPRPVSSFVKRAPYFDEVLQALNFNRRVWGAAIDGIGGVGKTSMALEIANHCVGHQLFERIIWTTAQVQRLTLGHINLSTPSGEHFYELEGLLDEIIRAFGFTELLFSPLQEKRRIAKNLLSTSHCLLVIDNLETIRDYVPIADFLENTPATTKIITTTRKQYLGRGERQIHLPPMSLAETSELVRNLCGRGEIDLIGKHVETLYEFLAGVPLAIVWSIGQFRMSPHQIDQFLARLRNVRLGGDLEEEEKRILEFCFLEAYKNLSQSGKNILKMLGLFPVPLRTSDIPEILGLGYQEFRAACDDLVRTFSLADEDFDENDQRCMTILPWTRLFIRYELSKEDNFKRDLSLRYANHYAHSKDGSNNICTFTPDYKPIFLPPRATPVDFAYNIHTEVGHEFESAKVNSEAVPMNHGLQNGDLVEVITAKSEGKPHRQWLNSARTKRARRAILTFLKKPQRAAISIQLGNALSMRCDVRNAEKEYVRAIELDPKRSWAYNRLGHHKRLTGETESALQLYEAVLSREPDNPFSHAGLAAVCYQEGRQKEAIRLYNKALHLRPNYENALLGLIRCHCSLGQYREAEAVLRRIYGLPVSKLMRALLSLFHMVTQLGLGDADSAVNVHLNSALHRFNRILPRRALEKEPYYGTHFLYYYSIALACASARRFPNYLHRASEVCSLYGLMREVKADLKSLRPRLLVSLEETVQKQFPRGTVVDKIDAINDELDRHIRR